MAEEIIQKRFEIPKPVSAGETRNVLIENQGGHGDGIANVDGFILFVKDARKGERCKVLIKDVKRTYAIAEKII
jgi:23S rRNA (uridine2552-2'-O)-methyltransferase